MDMDFALVMFSILFFFGGIFIGIITATYVISPKTKNLEECIEKELKRISIELGIEFLSKGEIVDLLKDAIVSGYKCGVQDAIRKED